MIFSNSSFCITSNPNFIDRHGNFDDDDDDSNGFQCHSIKVTRFTNHG